MRLLLAPRLLSLPLSVDLAGVNCESSFCCTSFGVGTTSDNLAVRVVRNPMAGSSCSSIVLG